VSQFFGLVLALSVKSLLTPLPAPSVFRDIWLKFVDKGDDNSTATVTKITAMTLTKRIFVTE